MSKHHLQLLALCSDNQYSTISVLDEYTTILNEHCSMSEIKQQH